MFNIHIGFLETASRYIDIRCPPVEKRHFVAMDFYIEIVLNFLFHAPNFRIINPNLTIAKSLPNFLVQSPASKFFEKVYNFPGFCKNNFQLAIVSKSASNFQDFSRSASSFQLFTKMASNFQLQ